MKEIPTDPMQAHSRFIEAFCADIIAGDVREAPRAKAVLEITKQLNRGSGAANNAPDSNHGQ